MKRKLLAMVCAVSMIASLGAATVYASDDVKATGDEKIALITMDSIDQHWITPVSYTHLDVYKRQMIYRAAMCCAICGGATALSHVNDAGFWLVTSFLEIDEKTTLKSWTIMETLIGVTALIVSFIVSIFA